MTETWFVMEGGGVGDPAKIRPDENGVLHHEDGRAVAYAPHGPRTRGGVDAEAERAKAGGKPQPKSDDAEAKDAKPAAQKGGYKTRETKAD